MAPGVNNNKKKKKNKNNNNKKNKNKNNNNLYYSGVYSANIYTNMYRYVTF